MPTHRQVIVLAHRAGFTRPTRKPKGGLRVQNSVPNAILSLSLCDGCEVDVGFTSDNIAVITRDVVKKLNLKKFKEHNPDHATLESWFEWYKDKSLQKKYLYLDLKTDTQNPLKLLKAGQFLKNRLLIGSSDLKTVIKCLLAKKILKSKAIIILQIPNPVYSQWAINYADRIKENLIIPKELAKKHSALIKNLKPDGLHFFFPESTIKGAFSELIGHGQIAPLLERGTPSGYLRFTTLPGFSHLRSFVLKNFVEEAKKRGYMVIGGSTASIGSMMQMIGWGVDTLMPNDPEYLPKRVTKKNKSKINPMKDKFKHSLDFSQQNSAAPNKKKLKNNQQSAYYQLAEYIKPTLAFRRFFGI